MFEIDSRSSHREILLFIRSLTRYEIAALCVFITNNYDVDIPSYSSKDEMVDRLKRVDKEVLLEGLDALFGKEEDEYEEEADEDDEESDD